MSDPFGVQPSVVSLSSPPATVRVLASTDELNGHRTSEDERRERDSLEETRNFYNIPSRTSSSSFQHRQASSSSIGQNYSRPVSPPPRPSSRQNSIRSIHDLSSPQNPQPPLPHSSIPASNTFTSGVLPPRGFFAPQQPRGAAAATAAAAAAASSSGTRQRRDEDVEMQRRTVGGSRHARGVTESEDDLGTGDESEHETARKAKRLSFSQGGASGTKGGLGLTASREPLISARPLADGNPAGWSDPSGQRGPSYPSMPTSPTTSQQPSSHPRPSHGKNNSSISTTRRNFNPPPPLSLASPPASTHFQLAQDGRSTPFTPAPTATPTPPHTASSSGKKTYAYQLHPSANSFFLRGKLLTGGDSPIPFLISLALVLGLGGLFIGTTGVNMWQDGVGGAGGGGGIAVVICFLWIWGVALGGMFGTAFRDPGIIPRNLDLAPPLASSASTHSLIPLPRDIRVRAGRVTVKYCETCKIYRPPRSSHCRVCGNCVDGIDHHCTYLHTCVGRRNYTSFMSFLVFTFLALVYTVIFSAIHLWRLTKPHNGLPARSSTFRAALGQNPGSAVSFALGVLLVVPVGLLMGYHLRLMANNSTTIEEIRRTAARQLTPRPASPFAFLFFWRARIPQQQAEDGSANPFRFKRWYTNFGRVLCRPGVPSWMEFDRVVDGRQGQGGHGEEKWGGR